MARPAKGRSAARPKSQPARSKPKPKPAADTYDLVIVGSGPAGSAAAIQAARRGAAVLLVDRAAFPRGRRCGGWVGPAAVELAESLGVDAAGAGAVKFTGLKLARWDMKQCVALADPQLCGWIVDRARFDAKLVEAARKAGAQVKLDAASGPVTLGEAGVSLTLTGGVQTGRVLLIADGADSPAARQLGLQPAGQLEHTTRMMFAEFDASGPGGVLVALGASRAGLLATVVTDGRRGRVVVATREPGGIESRFAEFARSAQAAGVLPARLGDPEACACPAGLALELDTHVGKRSLLIGDAGGFVAAFSGEGLYPAMKSGCVAAEAALRALTQPLPQDHLADFGAQWRTALADYLRMPNTDLSLLAPLVFGNPEMSRRVGRAFLLGTQF